MRLSAALLASFSSLTLLTVGCGSGSVGGSPDGFGGGTTSTSANGTGSGSGSNSDTVSVGSFTTASTGSGSNDCNGSNPEGCSCTTLGATQACYVGPMNQAGVGACTVGTQSCQSTTQGEIVTNAWGACVGSGAPSAEVCGDGIDNDCNGVVDDNCPTCTDGQQQMCTNPDGSPGVQSCVNGSWGGCGCSDGQTESCTDATGQTGIATCSTSVWGPCIVTPPGTMVGTPCTTGTSAPSDPNDPNCTYGGSVGSILYCDNTGVWQCFPNDGCTQTACSSCLQTNCGQIMSATTCPTQMAQAWTWLTECGPDRSSYFSNLESCADVGALNNCKFQYCYGDGMNGPCNLY